MSTELTYTKEKLLMLENTGRMGNLIDLLALISDGIEVTDDGMVEKMVQGIDKLSAASLMGENAIKFAKRKLEKDGELGSIFKILAMMKDEEVRKGLSFAIYALKGLGKQL